MLDVLLLFSLLIVMGGQKTTGVSADANLGLVVAMPSAIPGQPGVSDQVIPAFAAASGEGTNR